MSLFSTGLQALGGASLGSGLSSLASKYLGGGKTLTGYSSGATYSRPTSSSSLSSGKTPQERANEARAKEDARLAAQRRSTGTSSAGNDIGFRSLAQTWSTPTVVSQRTDTPQAQADAEVKLLQTQLLKQQLQGPTAGIQAGMTSLVNQYNRAFAQAKSDNEARFQKMLGIADDTTQQRAADIRAQGQAQIGDIRQRLARSGLGGSSVGNVEETGVARSTSAQLNTLADQMQGTKLGILQQMQPAYPDLAALQSTLTGVANQYEGGSGLSSLLKSFSGIQQ